ncbi:MAG TPA: type I methionyl aminopeptidase [Candidatus Limnocylindrales bacterium]
MVTRKSPAEIGRMRRAGRIVAEVLALVELELRPGVTTRELDAVAERHIRASGAVPSFKGYLGGRRYGSGPRAFPASICVSVDDEVVHGIPGERVLREGDVVSIDAGAIWEGWHGDGARTFIVGPGSEVARRLVETTHLALMAGIAEARPGNWLQDISGAVEDVARGAGFDLVRPYGGHGIGTDMHEDPHVPNLRTGQPGMRLEAGLCLAIEPMLTVGSADVYTLPDHWTVATRDGSLAAHFEHTVAITASGPQVLTTL